MSNLPRATAGVIGDGLRADGLRAFIDAGARAIEAAARAELPIPTPEPPRVSRSTGTDWHLAIAVIARRLLTARAFRYDAAELVADGDVIRVRAQHSCGSRLVVRITGEQIMSARRERDAVDLVVDAIDAAGCYCVLREVLGTMTTVLSLRGGQA